MRKLKWIWIWAGMHLLRLGMRYRIRGTGKQWLQPLPEGILVNRKDFLLKYCRNKHIVHIGFADAPFTTERIKNGTLLHHHLRKTTASCFGIDTNEEAVALYKQLTGDAEVGAMSFQMMPDDLMVHSQLFLAGEVLEHIADPLQFIRTCEEKMKAGQELLVTVPNYMAWDGIAASLNNTESVHPDHEWYFSPYTLLKKFDKAKWKLQEFAYGLYGTSVPNFIQKQFPVTGDCLIAVFKKL